MMSHRRDLFNSSLAVHEGFDEEARLPRMAAFALHSPSMKSWKWWMPGGRGPGWRTGLKGKRGVGDLWRWGDGPGCVGLG